MDCSRVSYTTVMPVGIWKLPPLLTPGPLTTSFSCFGNSKRRCNIFLSQQNLRGSGLAGILWRVPALGLKPLATTCMVPWTHDGDGGPLEMTKEFKLNRTIRVCQSESGDLGYTLSIFKTLHQFSKKLNKILLSLARRRCHNVTIALD